MQVSVERAWSGPLPDPQSLQHFEDVVPGSAARIFDAWEGETAHRHIMEKTDLRWAIMEGFAGKIFAFIFIIAALAISVFALTLGHQWFASIFGGATIVSVVTAFVATNRKPSKH